MAQIRMPIRIGFDISQTGRQKTGCGFFAFSAIQHLAKIDTRNAYILYPTFGDTYWDPDWATQTVRITQPNFKIAKGQSSFLEAKTLWNDASADIEAELGHPDIIHSNNFFCPTGLRYAKLVYTFYDFNFLEHPEWAAAKQWAACFDGSFNAGIHADFIIAISEASRRHFLRIFPHYPEKKTAVIYPASRFRLTPGLKQPESLTLLRPGQFWLNVGTLELKKNQVRLIRAYAWLKHYLGDALPLVLAGRNGGDLQNIQKLLQDLRLENDVILLNYVSDTDLPWLYQNCFAFVFPSLFEGFGLPLLEAMTLGAPVISSRNSCIPEIAGDAALLVNASRDEEITEAMLCLALGEVKREVLRDNGFRRARDFCWEKTAREILDCYGRVLAGASRPAFALTSAQPFR